MFGCLDTLQLLDHLYDLLDGRDGGAVAGLLIAHDENPVLKGVDGFLVCTCHHT